MMFYKFSRRILHLLYPTRCPVCGDFIGCFDNFCKSCTDTLPHYDGDNFVDGADGLAAAFYYDDNISPAVMLLKDGICGNAAYAMGNALSDSLSGFEFTADADMIIPVPLHRKDRRRRGYNQSELIGRQLSRRLGIPLRSDIIRKIRRTAEQKSLTLAERKVNLRDAFSIVKPEDVSGKTIILIDDVCTTGSTLAEAASMLKKNGADKVFCAACCKTRSTLI